MKQLINDRSGKHNKHNMDPWKSSRGSDSSPLPTCGQIKASLCPTEIYGSKAAKIGIRLGNGGAGQLGLFRALAEVYLQSNSTINGQPFSIAWYSLGTKAALLALKSGEIDLALVYPHEEMENALHGPQAYACEKTSVFRDYWILVGPQAETTDKAVPVALDQNDDVMSAFRKIAALGDSGHATFYSRADASANNYREQSIFTEFIEKEALLEKNWYLSKRSTPAEALKFVNANGCYTLSDLSTWQSHPELRGNLELLINGAKGEDSRLHNPCFGLLPAQPDRQSDAAKKFLEWMRGEQARRIIREFSPSGKKEGPFPFTPNP